MILTPYSAETADMLRHPPAAGQGRHHWLFRLAWRLVRVEGREPQAVRAALEEVCRARGWADRVGQVAGDVARVLATDAEQQSAPRQKWPEAHPDDRARLAARPRSWPTLNGHAPTACHVISTIYAPDDLVCVATTPFAAITKRAADVEPMAERLAYIVANPMTATSGRTADGRESTRCRGNACTDAKRRWVVVEFDTDDDLEAQCNILAALDSTEMPLRLAVFSGRRSVHGWYDGAGVPAADRLRLFRYAAWLGADRSLWDTAKLVRMPGGRRETGERQTVLYWGFTNDADRNA